MSKRREIEASLHSLHEIRDILNAMKNMARMEVHRLGRFLADQQRVASGIEAAGSDFFAFHPELLKDGEEMRDVVVLIGSERGFCGDFNEALLRVYRSSAAGANARVIVLGSKLGGKLGDGSPATILESASVVEEVESVLVRLVNTIAAPAGTGSSPRPLRVTVFHHDAQGGDVRVSVLHPFQRSQAAAKRYPNPPRLYLDPREFADGLWQHYLFARLHEMLYASLMVENQIRVQHMDSAVQRLEHKSSELFRRRNTLRQEEITEEIEVIMLSADALP